MYGPVRTVVWQGSAGDRRPYADQTRFVENDIGRLTRPRSGPRRLDVSRCRTGAGQRPAGQEETTGGTFGPDNYEYRELSSA